MKTMAAAAAFVLTATLAGTAHADPTVVGLWEQSFGDGQVAAWFLFEEKDGVYVGRVVKAFKKPGEKVLTTCEKCPGDRKGANMLGLTIIYDMKRDGLKYRDGSILDPRDGTLYHAQMDLSEDGKELGVRGYIGVPLLGMTQVWHRLPDNAMKPTDIPKEVLAKLN
jgi:uncharacterized protein (DUF2147 family)